MAAKSITIDIGAEFIKICESQKSKKTVMVHQVITAQTPENAVEDGFIRDVSAVTEVIQNSIREAQLQVKAVTFILNTSRVATKEVVLPYMPKDKIQEMINMNASDYFPVNIDDYVLSYTVLENTKDKKDRKTRILVFAAPEVMIQSYYSVGQMLGVKVKAVDYSGNSTLQLIKIQVDNTPTMAVQIGMDNTVVSIMKDNILQLQRTIPYGEALLVNSVKDAKKMTSKAAVELLGQANIIGETLDANEHTGTLKFLISNVNRVVEYYKGKNKENPVQKILIVGEGADVQGMDKLFAHEIGLPAESLTLLKNVDSYNRIKVSNSVLKNYMTNIGASLDPINFRLKADEKKAGISHGDKQYIIVGLVMVAIAVVISVFPTMQNGALNIQKAVLNGKINDIKDIEKIIADYDAAEAKYNDVNNFYISTESPAEDVVKFMEDLEAMIPKTMRINSFSISGGTVSLSASCQFKPEVSAFLIALKNNKRVTSVVMPGLTDNEGQVDFSCTIIIEKTPDEEMSTGEEGSEEQQTTAAGEGE